MSNFIQSFTKGMNTDTDVSSLPQGSYRLAKNLTFTTIENGTSGALENVKGNKLLTQISVFGPNDHEIVGYINILKDIVFFTYKESTSESAIWLYTASTGLTELFYTDLNTTDNSKLSFSNLPEDRIVGIGRYENEKIRKIYWTDGISEVRYANLENTYYDPAIPESLPVDRFSLVPTIELGAISTDENSIQNGGSLKAGAVQYSYRLFNKHGAETVFSSTTHILYLTEYTAANKSKFLGTDLDETVNKSVKVNLEDIDLDFDFIRVYRVFYKSYYDIPTIGLVHEGEVISSTFSIIDSGNTIEEVPLEEFTAIGGRVFTAEALASKNNHLFAGNIKEEYFDANIDCRAYRFNKPSTTALTGTVTLTSTDDFYLPPNPSRQEVTGWAVSYGNINDAHVVLTGGKLYLNGEGEYKITTVSGDIVNHYTSSLSANVLLLLDTSAKITKSLTIPGSATGSFDYNTSFIKSGTSLQHLILETGATTSTNNLELQSGSMITIEFYSSSMPVSLIDGFNGETITIESDGSWSSNLGPFDTDWSIVDTFDCINRSNDLYNNLYTGNSSTVNYLYTNDGYLGGSGKYISYKIIKEEGAEPILEGFTPIINSDIYTRSTFKINEVYRFGIVFFDEKGRQSFVNWIGDILIPYFDEDKILKYHFNTKFESGATKVYPIHTTIKFSIDYDNFPVDLKDNIVGAKIVFVERDLSSSINYTQGFAGSIWRSNSTPLFKNHSMGAVNNPFNQDSYYFTNFYSPNTNIGKAKTGYTKSKLLPIVNEYADTLISRDRDGSHGIHNNSITFAFSSSVTKFESIDMYEIKEEFNLTRETGSMAATSFIGKWDENTTGTVVEETMLFENRVESIDTNSDMLEYYSPELMLLTTDDGILTTSGTSTTSIRIWDVIKDTAQVVYGGNTYSNRITSTYIPCSAYLKLGSGFNDITAYGDTFISIYEQMTRIYDPDWTEGLYEEYASQHLFMVPLESKINYSYIGTKPSYYMDNKYTVPPEMGIEEEYLVGIATYPTTYPDSLKDLYSYNNVYSIPPFGLHPKYSPKPLLFEADQTNHVMVISSEKKTNGEYIDNWTKFLYSSLIEVDTKYGGVTELKSLDNKLFFWQEKAFGMLAVNDRSLIQDNSGAQLSLGVGGVLERYDYLSNNVGVLEKYNVTYNENTLFWIYSPLEKVYIYDNQIKELSTVSSVNSYLHGKAPFENPICMVDYINHETLFRINDEVLTFSWMSNSFTGIYTYEPYWFIPEYEGNYLSSPNANKFEVWRHNAEEDSIGNPLNRGNFYSIDNPSYIHFIVNKDYYITKVFDSMNWFSTSLFNGINQYEDTFSRVRMYNDYQNTDWVELRMEDDIVDPTLKKNITRRERSFFHQITRDLVKSEQKANVYIFDPNNLDSSQSYKRRMRDKFLHVELEYENTSGNKFFFPYVNINYRQSIR